MSSASMKAMKVAARRREAEIARAPSRCRRFRAAAERTIRSPNAAMTSGRWGKETVVDDDQLDPRIGLADTLAIASAR